MKSLPKLYKKTKTGAVEEWIIEFGDDFYCITHGQVGGAMQQKINKVKKKNVGKANETSLAEQAEFEAESRWKKQLDKGYSQNISKLDRVIPSPMLAKAYEDNAKKVEYPCFVQPKLDGVRCLAYYDDGKVILLSRQGKRYNIPHIEQSLKELYHVDDGSLDGIVFDGELYIHNTPFQKLVSWVKKDQPDTSKLEYHIYDIVWDRPFAERTSEVMKIMDYYVPASVGLVDVETIECSCEEEIFDNHTKFLQQGYEGTIIRYGKKGYETGFRSQYLLKLKEFVTEEFEIIGAEQDDHKPAECTFLLQTKDGTSFRCKPEGSQEFREQLWTEYQDDDSNFLGKFMTVRYFEMTTSENPVPRFPVGVSIRDYE